MAERIDADQAWSEALDLFEADLEAGEPSDGWRDLMPQTPLPAHLAPRAERIVRAQQRIARELSQKAVETRREMQAVDRVPTSGRDPVYLDVEG